MSKINASEALKPFKVLDLSRVRAGPNCVRILTDFGADVIRIEPPQGVDPNEAMFAANRHGGDFQNLNRNKRSLIFLRSTSMQSWQAIWKPPWQP